METHLINVYLNITRQHYSRSSFSPRGLQAPDLVHAHVHRRHRPSPSHNLLLLVGVVRTAWPALRSQQVAQGVSGRAGAGLLEGESRQGNRSHDLSQHAEA